MRFDDLLVVFFPEFSKFCWFWSALYGCDTDAFQKPAKFSSLGVLLVKRHFHASGICISCCLVRSLH